MDQLARGAKPEFEAAMKGGTMYRQGDVLIVRAMIPQGAKPVDPQAGRYVLAEGEHTGHAHAIALAEAPMVQMFTMGRNQYLRVAGSTAMVKHEEHATVDLPPGEYRVFRQREYVADRPARSVRVAD